jgi:membrane protein
MRMQKQDIWPMLKQTGSEFFEHKAQTLAAALAVYTMLSIAPLLVIVTKVAGVMYKDAPHEVSEAMTGVVPGMQRGDIETMITEAGRPGEGVLATVISTALVIFGATGVFGQLQDSMNTIWEVKPKPNQGVWGFIRTRFLSLAMVLGIAFLFMVSTVGTTLVTTVGESIAGKDNKVIAWILAHSVSLVVMWTLFTLMFKVLPDAKTAWKDCMIGAAITAVLFEAGKIGLAMYLEGSATKVFGAAGSLAALLLFIYYSAQIMFLGAEFTRVYAEKYGAGLAPAPHAVKVTEEDKAKEGRPSEGRVEAKTARSEGRGPARGGAGAARRPAARQSVASPAIPGYATAWRGARGGNGQGGWSQYALAGAGVVAGALVGGLGAMALAKDEKRPAKKHIAAVKLDERMRNVEGRIGKLSRIHQYLENETVYQRIRQVEKHIRHARTAIRAEATGRPKWLVRLGDLVAGNKN